MRNFNPLGRKTETSGAGPNLYGHRISIHSVARPRQSGKVPTLDHITFQSTRSQDRDISGAMSGLSGIYFNPLGRKTETISTMWTILFQFYFNPLGRKTETFSLGVLLSSSLFQSTRSQDRDPEQIFNLEACRISIHSVARPRLAEDAETKAIGAFQSTRSQDRDNC